MSQSTVVLTIDKNSLRDLWLPAVKAEAESIDFMWREVTYAGGLDRSIHLVRAWDALCSVHRDTVRVVQGRGGLLLIGGKF